MPSNRPQQRRAPNRRPSVPQSGPRAPRSGASSRPGPTPATPGSFRAGLERASYPLLVRITRMPKWLLGLLTGGLLIAGLMAPLPWGLIAMAIVALFLTWLLALAWPKLDTSGRLVRGAVAVAAITVVVARATGAL